MVDVSSRHSTTAGSRGVKPVPGFVIRIFRAGLLALAMGSVASHAAPEPIAVSASGLSSSPGPLAGQLFHPQGRGPHPAVVMMYGCGGAYGRDGSLNARHRMWANI